MGFACGLDSAWRGLQCVVVEDVGVVSFRKE